MSPASSRQYGRMPDHRNCAAGRTAFFGGRWTTACPAAAIHEVGSPAQDPILLCDEHFRQVHAAGLVTDPYLDKEEYDRRERERLGVAEASSPRRKRRWFQRR
jgi:glycerophosphoryl diester phosphodiesterase